MRRSSRPHLLALPGVLAPAGLQKRLGRGGSASRGRVPGSNPIGGVYRRPEQAPDTLIHFWLSDNGLVAMADSNFSHPTNYELCAEGRGVWATCALPEAPWRFSFITRDSIHIGEPDAPRAVMTRSRRDRLQ